MRMVNSEDKTINLYAAKIVLKNISKLNQSIKIFKNLQIVFEYDVTNLRKFLKQK
jgi:hypothetical protein